MIRPLGGGWWCERPRLTPDGRRRDSSFFISTSWWFFFSSFILLSIYLFIFLYACRTAALARKLGSTRLILELRLLGGLLWKRPRRRLAACLFFRCPRARFARVVGETGLEQKPRHASLDCLDSRCGCGFGLADNNPRGRGTRGANRRLPRRGLSRI